MASVFLLVFFLLLHLPLLQSTEEEITYAKKCPPFYCRNLTFGFPFANKSHPECGVFTVECPVLKDPTVLDHFQAIDSNGPRIQLGDGGRSYPLLNIFNNTLRIFDQELMKFLDPELAYRCESFTNLPFPSSSFFSFEIVSNQTIFFKCDRTLNVIPPPDFKTIPCAHSIIYYNLSNKSFPDAFSGCSIIQLPENSTPENSSGALRPLPNRDDPFPLVSPEFDLEVHVSSECYECFYKGGKCNATANGKFYCDDGTEDAGNNRLTAMQLALGALLIGVGILMVAICYVRRQFLSNSIIYFWKRKGLTQQTAQVFLRDHGTLVIKQYSYLDIKKITNSFKEKLGEGGYGGVYKGMLQDGFLVAVKVLKESKGNGEEFINEIASISKTSHVNIVSLIGFCFEGSKRALIYKFMPNGSLEKFIYKVNPSKNIHILEWETIYKIALGIARGLEYLHRGCNTQILHFDIKPHNILLDENFCPKISDFGLAKICPREQSILSMLGTRGTIGYIAPEVFCRSFGKVSHKSDVYSYGMMVFEMIGGRKNIEVDVDHTSEIYFPHWIYKRLEQDKNLGLQNVMNENDHESARKMIIVSLWCIQTDPSNRPSMSRVVNMLEGLEQLEVPPEPFLSLPSRSEESSSTTMGSLQYNFVIT